MLTLYLDPAFIPMEPSPAFRAMPPCCARNLTKPAATVRADSNAPASSNQVGIPAVSEIKPMLRLETNWAGGFDFESHKFLYFDYGKI
jgi:hypothetical protein